MSLITEITRGLDTLSAIELLDRNGAVEGGREEDDGDYEIRRVRLQPEMVVNVSYIY